MLDLNASSLDSETTRDQQVEKRVGMLRGERWEGRGKREVEDEMRQDDAIELMQEGEHV